MAVTIALCEQSRWPTVDAVVAVELIMFYTKVVHFFFPRLWVRGRRMVQGIATVLRPIAFINFLAYFTIKLLSTS